MNELREELIVALRRCRVEDGSPAPLFREGDLLHIASMLLPIVERVVAEARAEERSSMQVSGYAAGTMRVVEVGQAQRALDAAREAGRAEVVAKVEAVHCQIGPYRATQAAIGDLDREHIDVLAVGTILSDLRRELVAKYNAAIRAALGKTTDGPQH